MAITDQPLPRFPEPDTQPFWEATKSHELRYQVFDDCGGVVFHPRRHCTHCLSQRLSWRNSKGEGTIYTYIVVRQNYHAAFRPRVPYGVAWTEARRAGARDPRLRARVPRQRVATAWRASGEGAALTAELAAFRARLAALSGEVASQGGDAAAARQPERAC